MTPFFHHTESENILHLFIGCNIFDNRIIIYLSEAERMKTKIRTHNHHFLISAAAPMTLLLIFLLNSCSLFPNGATLIPTIRPSGTNSPSFMDITRVPETPTIDWITNTKQPALGESTISDCIDQAMPGKPFDVTIPDGMIIYPGRNFTKTWRLMNSGTCPWTTNYSMVWFSGAELTQQNEINLPDIVNPGDEVDLSVEMIAPMEPGEVQSNWKLSNNAGVLFGIGPNGDSPFWARVIVLQEISATPEKTYSPTAEPLVFSTGVSIIIIEDGFDLDNGLQNPASGIDISLHQLDNGDLVLVPANGTRLTLAKNDASFYYCTSTVLTDDGIIISAEMESQSFCYQTNLGLPGVLKFTQIQLNEQFIEISYVTWIAP